MANPFSRFNNASLTINREETESTYRGEESTGSETPILRCRCDVQESGRSLQQARDVYEAADIVVFPSQEVDVVDPQDSVTIEHDDGRTLEGTVERVMALDDKLLVSL